MSNKNETILVAAFADEAAAEAAIEHLRQWDKRVGEVKLGVIGRVHRTAGGVVESHVVHGGLFNRSMPISKAGVQALAEELGSQIGVVVGCDDYEAGMVSDSLVSNGGKILLNTYERTPEEIAKEEKEMGDALTAKAIRESAEKARLSPGGMNRPQ